MSEGQGFALHPLAAQDINDIWGYIAEDNPLAARRVREDILSAIRALAPFPNQGHKRPDLTSRPLRFTLVREYLIAYAPDERPLWVVAVMHGRRSPRVMAAILRAENSSTRLTWLARGSTSAVSRANWVNWSQPDFLLSHTDSTYNPPITDLRSNRFIRAFTWIIPAVAPVV